MGIETAVAGLGVAAGLWGSKKSADATKDASRDANAAQVAMYNQSREDLQPWRNAGMAALDRIEETPSFQFSLEDFDFMADPSYDFRKEEGINALDRSAASRGRTLSGAQDRAVTRYGSDLASTEYQNAFNRHQSSEINRFNTEKGVYDTNMNTNKSLAGVGQQATNSIQNAGANTTNALSRNLMTAGQAQSDAYGGMATSLNTGLENALIAYKKPTDVMDNF